MATFRGTIDFFEGQRDARRRTALLLAWFGLALAAVTGLVYLALLLPTLVPDPAAARWWNPGLLAASCAGVLAVTGGGVAWHAAALRRGGGEALAVALGGSELDRRSADRGERRVLNVVEEMAIAAGLPVPRVFVLRREEGINAFAAGPTPGHAVLGVTRGALDRLSRDELQAVVAHELSHVLNGDVVLAARLMGLVGGLTILDLAGRETLRLAWPRGRGEGFRLLLFPTGLVLATAGALGVLSAQLVRCGVSRQREYLADAAAVQFTRNPEALARALARIAEQGSAIRHARALEAAHLFFANALAGAFDRFLATHPPLEERIRRIDPQRTHELRRAGAMARADAAVRPSDPTPAGVGEAAAGEALLAGIGVPVAAHLARAGAVLAALPGSLAEAARSASGARRLVTTLALSREPLRRAGQLAALEARAAPEAGLAVRDLARACEALDREQRLVLMDLALPSLDALADGDAEGLAADLRALELPGGAPEVFAWTLRRLALRRLERRPTAARAPPVRFHDLVQVEVECLALLSLLAWAGTRDPGPAQAALARGAAALGAAPGWRVLPRERLGVAAADAALRQLDLAARPLKARVLRACAATVAEDGRVTAPEAELLRAISGSLGCPMPALLPGRAAAVASAPAA